MSDAQALAAAIRDLPALHAKRDLQLVRRLGAVGDGDDGALIAHGDDWIVLCGEAILPSFVAAKRSLRCSRRARVGSMPPQRSPTPAVASSCTARSSSCVARSSQFP